MKYKNRNILILESNFYLYDSEYLVKCVISYWIQVYKKYLNFEFWDIQNDIFLLIARYFHPYFQFSIYNPETFTVSRYNTNLSTKIYNSCNFNIQKLCTAKSKFILQIKEYSVVYRKNWWWSFSKSVNVF